MNINKVACVGYGTVGKSTGYALGITRFIDKGSLYTDDQLEEIQCFILCLPTPTVKGKQDLSVIEEWLSKLQALEIHPIVIIRSTILPGTTDRLSKQYNGLKIVHVDRKSVV